MQENDFAQKIIDKQYELAIRVNQYAYQLNNTFVQLELLLQTKNTLKFKQIYDERIKLFDPESLDKYRIYMHWFLARSYTLIDRDDEAIKLLNAVSEKALAFEDTKLLVHARITLSEIYTDSNPQKALEILESIAHQTPNPNPYLWVKAQILVKLDRKLDALTALIQAKDAFNELWSAENQALLDALKSDLGA